MRLLFDKNVPVGVVRGFLAAHEVRTLTQMKWPSQLENGELLKTAETAGFDVVVTADQNIRYQQKLTGRQLALVVLGSNIWPIVLNYGGGDSSQSRRFQTGELSSSKCRFPQGPEGNPQRKRSKAAVGEKAASLKTLDYVRERARQGDRLRFEQVLAKVPDVEPEEADRLPEASRKPNRPATMFRLHTAPADQSVERGSYRHTCLGLGFGQSCLPVVELTHGTVAPRLTAHRPCPADWVGPAA